MFFVVVRRVAARTFSEAAKPKAPVSEDPIKKIFAKSLSDYAAKKPKDFDAKALADAIKNKPK